MAERTDYGSPVVNGVLRYVAPTTIGKADPHSSGCLRRWFYRYVLKWKTEEGAWLDVGKTCHSEIETSLITGANVLGPISGAARRFVDPLRGQRLLLEHDIGGGVPDFSRARLILAGVPMIGYCDVIHETPAIDDNAEPFGDPPGTVEVLDWKFGAAKIDAEVCYAKKPHELATDVQMMSEAAWVYRVFDTDMDTRVSHVYTNTKGRARSTKSSILVSRDHVERRMEYVSAIVRTMIDAAHEINPDAVTPNTNACSAFGGCPYAEKCSAFSTFALDSFFGGQGELGLLAALNLQGDSDMGLMDAINIPGITPAAPAVPASPVPVVANASGVAAVIGGHDIASQMAAMGALGAQAAAAVTAPPPAPAWPPGFPEAIAEIDGKGYGQPPMKDGAALAYANLRRAQGQQGYASTNGPFAGTGDLARVEWVSDPARIIGIATEMRALPVKPRDTVPAPVTTPPVAPVTSAPAAPMGLVSPDAPASNPALAALPVEGFQLPGTAPTAALSATTPNVMVPGLVASVPATVAAPILAAGAPAIDANTAGIPAANTAPEKPKSGKGSRGPRKPKTTEGAAPGASSSTASEESPMWLFVDCRPNLEHNDLQDHVDTWAIGVGRHFKCDYDDVRLADKNGPLGFGGWKGAMAGVARAAAKTLPVGAWYLDTSSDINAAVLEGLRSARHDDGSPIFELVVKGTR